MLSKVQKALGEYLERQRAAFSRFYFVGDEDLLEIIGNGRDPVQIQRHLAKMFAGITAFELDVSAVVLSRAAACCCCCVARLESECVSSLTFLRPVSVQDRSSSEQPDAGGSTPDADVWITAMASRQGEVVALHEAVSVAADPRVNIWLTKAETAMRLTLVAQLDAALRSAAAFLTAEGAVDVDKFVEWVDEFAAQIIVLSTGVQWCSSVDGALSRSSDLQPALDRIIAVLGVLASRVVAPLAPDRRSKYEQLITELVHQRDVSRHLISKQVSSAQDFDWLYHLRHYWPAAPGAGAGAGAGSSSANIEHLEDKLRICVANAEFSYGFEYQGVGERLVQTPLTDRCYLTLTQALHLRLGGKWRCWLAVSCPPCGCVLVCLRTV